MDCNLLCHTIQELHEKSNNYAIIHAKMNATNKKDAVFAVQTGRKRQKMFPECILIAF